MRMFVLCLACLFTGQLSAITLPELLANTGKAYREINYSGILTYEYGANLETLNIVHGVSNGEEFEKLSTLDGKPFEIVRQGHHLACIHPGDKLLRNREALSIKPAVGYPSSESFASSVYSAQLRGKNRIANRPVYVTLVIPKDKMRNAYELSIDMEYHVVLKRVVLSPEGKVLERMQFSHIEYLTELAPDVKQRAEGSIEIDHDLQHGHDQPVQNGEIIAVPEWIPEGYVQSYLRGFSSSGVQMSSYSDGLSSFSVFLEPTNARTAALKMDGRARRGATVAYTLPLVIAGKPFVMTVLGEIPLMTAARIAQNISIERVVGS